MLLALAVPSVAAAQTTAGTSATEPAVPATELPTEAEPLVAAVRDGAVVLTWLEAAPTPRLVQRSADGGETYIDLAAVEGALLTYTDEAVDPGTYLYRLVADGTDPELAPTVTVEVPEVDAVVPDPTDPAPKPPPIIDGDPDPLPEPGGGTAKPSDPDAPDLPSGNGSPDHSLQPPTVPDGSSGPHAGQPRGVRSAGADLQPLRESKLLRLLPPRRLAGMVSLSLPYTPRPLAAPPAPLVADPVLPASVAAAVMPLGPVVATPPRPQVLVATAETVPSAPIALALALLLATACGHVARRAVTVMARSERSPDAHDREPR